MSGPRHAYDNLAALAEELAPDVSLESIAGGEPIEFNGGVPAERVAELVEIMRTRAPAAWRDPGDQSDYDWALANEAIGAGFTDDEIHAVLVENRLLHHPDDRKAEREDYFARTIAKARAKADAAQGDRPPSATTSGTASENGSGPDPTEVPAGARPSYRFASFADFAAHSFPDADPLIGKRGSIYLAVGSLLLVYGGDGAGKSTWTIDAAAHLGAGRDWLGLPVPRPARCLLVENEGPAALFQAKLKAKRESWEDGDDFRPNVHLYVSPWGDFSFADPNARQALTEYCEEHEIDVVMANPTLGLGVAASGRPDETQQFVDWLKECGLGSRRAFWLLHHENKSGQISGDWGRHPDTKAMLAPDGNSQRTKLIWEKTRWATLEPDEKALMLDWVLETQGYTVSPLDTVGASDELLVERLVAYLKEHPATATKHVCAAVAGTDSRLTGLLKTRPEFDCADGSHGAKLWTATSTSAGGPPQ